MKHLSFLINDCKLGYYHTDAIITAFKMINIKKRQRYLTLSKCFRALRLIDMASFGLLSINVI